MAETKGNTREVVVLDAGENEWGRYPTLGAARARQRGLRIYTTTVCTECARLNCFPDQCPACEGEVRS